jgi:hypothetical protein
LQPSPEAVEWGKRQAACSPRWSASKWSRIATILQVEFSDIQPSQETDQEQADNFTQDVA